MPCSCTLSRACDVDEWRAVVRLRVLAFSSRACAVFDTVQHVACRDHMQSVQGGGHRTGARAGGAIGIAGRRLPIWHLHFAQASTYACVHTQSTLWLGIPKAYS